MARSCTGRRAGGNVRPSTLDPDLNRPDRLRALQARIVIHQVQLALGIAGDDGERRYRLGTVMILPPAGD
jgi:hypothetical protein